MLFDEIKKVRIKAKKDKNKDLSIATEMIIGEADRFDKKLINDELILTIIDRLIKSERDLLKMKREKTSKYLDELIEFERPKCSDETMINYFSKIDFSKLKNKLAAIGMLKKEFGDKNVNSNRAKEILEKY